MTPNTDQARREFEDYVRSQWTAGYECPRIGDGYADPKVDFAWRAVVALASATPQPTDATLAMCKALYALEALEHAKLADGTYADKNCAITFALRALRAAIAQPPAAPHGQSEAGQV